MEDERPDVLATYPANLQTDVPLDAQIQVRFSTDMDPSSITSSVFYVSQVYSNVPVPAAEPVYRDQYAFLKPLAHLQPSTVYRVTIIGDAPISGVTALGVRDILGRRMRGSYEWTFVTAKATAPLPPEIVSPVNDAVLHEQPVFVWSGNSLCHVQVAFDSGFTRLVFSGVGTPGIMPDAELEDGTYWWRIRLADSASAWSSPMVFAIATPRESPVFVDFDEVRPEIVSPLGFIFPESTSEILVKIPGVGYGIDPSSVSLVGRAIVAGAQSHGDVSVSVQVEETRGNTLLRVRLV